MATQLTKLDVARHQLGTALDLFIRNRDPVAVQCLACGGAELIETIATLADVAPLSTHILETMPHLDVVKLRNIQRQYWNAFKHMTCRSGEPRDDAELLAGFDDTKNDAALFVGWWDYQAVTKRLPVQVQVFQVWWYALNETKLAADADREAVRAAFPNIAAVDRAEQKRRLRRAVEKYRNNKGVLADSRTEVEPLCFSTIAPSSARSLPPARLLTRR
jgi:hypothetical protein